MLTRTKINCNKSIANVFLIYWLVLLAWQNISRVTARSGFDMILKIILIAYLTLYILSKSISVSKSIVPLFFVTLSFIITFANSNDSFTVAMIIWYVYPLLLFFLTYVVGDKFEVSKKEYLFFLKCVISAVLYMALYSLFFYTDHFIYFLTIVSAYGNELDSFLYSNHEYGLYLVYGIISCIVCLEEKQYKSLIGKIIYFILIGFFLLNLVLTFSRTSLLALLAIFICYLFYKGNNIVRKITISSSVIIFLLFIISSEARHFLHTLIYKGGNNNLMGAREYLYKTAIQLFSNGTLLQKLFGQGHSITAVFESITGLPSTHSAYIQILLTYGIVGVGFIFAIFFTQAKACAQLFKISKFYSVLFFSLLVSAIALMMSNTTIIFTSQIDSYFLTMFTIIIPKYVSNSIFKANSTTLS